LLGSCSNSGEAWGPTSFYYGNAPTITDISTGGAGYGTASLTASASKSYTLTCGGSVGTGQISIPVTVAAPPVLSISATNPVTGATVHSTSGNTTFHVPVGSSSTFGWSASNVQSCAVTKTNNGSPVAFGPYDTQSSGNITVSGVVQSTAAAVTKVWTFVCKDSLGATWPTQPSITIITDPDPVLVTWSATPTTLIAGSGQTATVSWNVSNVSSCTVSGTGGYSGSGTSGSMSVSYAAGSAGTKTFTLSCFTPSGTQS